MALSRDAILAADDRKTQEVEVPEWGGTVIVKALSGEERDAFEASMYVRVPKLGSPNDYDMVQDLENIHAKLVARSVVGDDGERLFNDADIAALGKKSASALRRVFDVAASLSGVGADAEAEIEGNS